MTSPPGVRTEKVVFASASPPGALTSFRSHGCGAVAQCCLRDLSRLHAQIGADHRVCVVGRGALSRQSGRVEQRRDDAVIAFGQAEHFRRLCIGEDQLGLGAAAVGNIDLDLQLLRWEGARAKNVDDAQAAGIQDDALVGRLAVDDDASRHAGQSECGMHDVGAVSEREERRRLLRLRNELMAAVRLGALFEDAPADAGAHRLRVAGGEDGAEIDQTLARLGGRWRLGAVGTAGAGRARCHRVGHLHREGRCRRQHRLRHCAAGAEQRGEAKCAGNVPTGQRLLLGAVHEPGRGGDEIAR